MTARTFETQATETEPTCWQADKAVAESHPAAVAEPGPEAQAAPAPTGEQTALDVLAGRLARLALEKRKQDNLALRRLAASELEERAGADRAGIEVGELGASIEALERKHSALLADCAKKRGYGPDDKVSSAALMGTANYPGELAGAHNEVFTQQQIVERCERRLSGIVKTRRGITGAKDYALVEEATGQENPTGWLAAELSRRATALVAGVSEQANRDLGELGRATPGPGAGTDVNTMRRSVLRNVLGRVVDSHGEAVAEVLRHLLASEHNLSVS